jgi:hypothetical protein
VYDPERNRYPGVEDLFRRATFLRETHRRRRRRKVKKVRKVHSKLTQ